MCNDFYNKAEKIECEVTNMNKNILLIHGFNGITPIFYYFKKELEAQGYNVIIPEFPVREKININEYFKVLDIYKEIINENLIVIAHSLGNSMFIKYICKHNLKAGLYISLAGFAEAFYVEGKDVLNKVIEPLTISSEEKAKIINLIDEKYSIYSDNDHIVPFKTLKEYSLTINSKPIFIPGIGHMGKTSGLKSLPQVVEIIKSNSVKEM